MVSYESTLKILLLGDPEVDKSAIIWRNIYQRRTSNERLTIGVDFFVKTLVIDDKRYKLQLWDVGGAERFRFLLPTYCLGANAVVLLYDVTRFQTLDNIGEWVNIVRKRSGDIPIMLIGILPDENNKRQVSAQEGKKIATSKNLNGYFECNLKTGENVVEAFEALTRLILVDEKEKKLDDYLSKTRKLKKIKRRDNGYSKSDIKPKIEISSPKPPSKPPLPPPSLHPSPPAKQPGAPVIIPQGKESYRNKIISLLSKLGSSLDLTNPKIIATALIKGRDTILYSTDNWDISADVGRVISSWSSMNARFIMLSGVKYSVLQCTSEMLVATSIRGEGHIIGAKDEDYKIIVYLRPDGEPMGATMDAARALSELRSKQIYFDPNFQLGATGGNFKANVRVNLNPQLKGEIHSFLEWIKDSEGLSGYINYYLQQNNPSIISELSKIYSELRQIIEESSKRSKFSNFDDSENSGDDNFDGDDFLPYPYIFTHPHPPDDFEPAPQSQLRAPLKEKDAKDEITCQYCGRELTKEAHLIHSCKKKP